MLSITRGKQARLAVAGLSILLTAIVLLVFGLSTTSALIEVGVFLAWIAAWAVLGRAEARRVPSPLRAKRLRSRKGGVEIEHEGEGGMLLSDIDADKDIAVRHRPGA